MYEYVVVGGGIHGTCLANYLVAEGGYSNEEIRIVDPRKLLESFATKARQCGMRTLRSTFVQHVDIEPDSLVSFAERRGREEELVTTPDYPDRPTLDLFLDHARAVVDRRSLGDCHHRATVTGITEQRGSLRLETDEGELRTRRVVLAIGLGGQPTIPAWTSSLSDDAPVGHVWDETFDPATAGTVEGQTVVVGGGITAAQLACHLSDRTTVTLLSRHALSLALSEADPYWINWPYIEEQLHTLPPGSAARHDRIRAARNDATIPPYVHDRLTAAQECGTLDVRRGEITCVLPADDGLVVRFADGGTATPAQVLLATGLDPVPEQPLVGSVARSLGLQRGANGFPVLDDRTLAWQHTDGSASRVFVSGALAETSVGPFARNVVGARRVAERLLAAPDGTDSDRATAPASGRP